MGRLGAGRASAISGESRDRTRIHPLAPRPPQARPCPRASRPRPQLASAFLMLSRAARGARHPAHHGRPRADRTRRALSPRAHTQPRTAHRARPALPCRHRHRRRRHRHRHPRRRLRRRLHRQRRRRWWLRAADCPGSEDLVRSRGVCCVWCERRAETGRARPWARCIGPRARRRRGRAARGPRARADPLALSRRASTAGCRPTRVGTSVRASKKSVFFVIIGGALRGAAQPRRSRECRPV